MDVLQSAAEAAAQLDEQLAKRGKSLSWASPTTKELVITTWNVWFDPFARFTRWAALLEEVMMLAPDVACLQEVVPEFLAVLKASVFVAEHYITSDAGLVAAGKGGLKLTPRRTSFRVASGVPLPNTSSK